MGTVNIFSTFHIVLLMLVSYKIPKRIDYSQGYNNPMKVVVIKLLFSI